jgi:hypothetical protein
LERKIGDVGHPEPVHAAKEFGVQENKRVFPEIVSWLDVAKTPPPD